MSTSDEYEGPLARNYDALYGVMRDPSGDAAFYRALAQEIGGPLLELGCGTGRYLIGSAILRPDHDHLGIDVVDRLVREATRRADRRGLAKAESTLLEKQECR